MILERFRAQLEALKPYIERAEAEGDGVHIEFNAYARGQTAPPKITIHPKNLTKDESTA